MAVMPWLWMLTTIKLNWRKKRWGKARCVQGEDSLSNCSRQLTINFTLWGGWQELHYSWICPVLEKISLFANKIIFTIGSLSNNTQKHWPGIVNKSRIQMHHQQSFVIGSRALCESVFHQMDAPFYMLVPAFILNTAVAAFFLRCYLVLRWQIGGTNFDIDPYSHSHMIPRRKCSWTFQEHTGCQKGAMAKGSHVLPWLKMDLCLTCEYGYRVYTGNIYESK